MSSTITIPQGFSYVGAGLLSTVGLLIYQSFLVGKFRKRAGINYPQLYAERAQAEASKDAHLFNCAQRAHQNTLENLPIVYVLTLFSGLKFPLFAAAASGYWTLARVSYTRGYLTGDPQKRGTIFYTSSYLGVFGMLFASVYTVVDAIRAGI